MTPPIALKSVIERLATHLPVHEIWLFGSRASGLPRPDSDYDLLVVLRDGASEEALNPAAAWQLVQGIGVPVDIALCTRSEFREEENEIDTLARESSLRGIRIYEHAA